MSAEREAIAGGGVGPAADEGFGGDQSARGDDGATSGRGASGGGNVPTSGSDGGSEGDSSSRRPILPRAQFPSEDLPPVEGCEDADKVARQLCEAATKEEDPLLRAALWDEYNEYVKIIGR